MTNSKATTQKKTATASKSPHKHSPAKVKKDTQSSQHQEKTIEIIDQNPFTIKFLHRSVNRLLKSSEDPGLALNIHMDNLSRGLTVVNTAAAPLILPIWMPEAAYPVTMDGFIRSVLHHAQAVTSGGVVDNFCIAPNTNIEAISVHSRFFELNNDPFVIAVANGAGGPLARVHAFLEQKVVQQPIAVNIPRPMALAPPNIQAFC